MGEIEVDHSKQIVKIQSTLFIYGDSATEELTSQFADEVETMWNEVEGSVIIEDRNYNLLFQIEGIYKPNLLQSEVLSNLNPRNNYFRIEDYSPINISWVDGIGSNTGYMFLDNLYKGSSTAAHEYGHTIGLEHPQELNLIGKGVPGIMYPRGTLVDPDYQYDPKAIPMQPGGTMHPMHRRVWPSEIELLNIPKKLAAGQKYLGNFTSVYHGRHFNPAI